MPRFFFHVRDGKNIPDDTGEELSSTDQAQLHAIRYMSDLMRDNPRSFWTGHDWEMRVTDERGLTYFILNFYSAIAPVMRSDLANDRS